MAPSVKQMRTPSQKPAVVRMVRMCVCGRTEAGRYGLETLVFYERKKRKV